MGAQYINIGDKFGDWEVIEYDDNTYLICRCSCGIVRRVNRYDLLNGKSKSCGRGKNSFRDLKGQHFGEWEVLEYTGDRRWLCRCSCGTVKEVKTPNLVNGLSKSCGCKHKIKCNRYSNRTEYDSIDCRDDIIKFIQDNTKVKVVTNDITVLNGAELDIYIPEKKLAIEFNGNYWHDDEHKSSNYHKHKTLACGARGIHLVTIFEYEWNNKILRDKLKNILLDLISDNIETIQARKTVVREISNSDAIEFCNKYHLQNGIYSRVNIGEFYNNELVGVMSFSIPRFNSGFDWEISRLCFKGGVKVIGGADKMFKMFLRKYNPSNVISYCDISKFVGIIYRKIGFKLTEITPPGYIWVDKHNDVLSRYKTQKHKLIAQGLGTEDETEDSIMKSLGHHKVYNCGNARYEYYNDKK